MTRIILALTLFSIVSCSSLKSNSQEQGIVEGRVVYESGNKMPGPDAKIGAAAGVKREIYIFNLINLGSVHGSIIPFDKITNDPVKTVMSDEEGDFNVKLEEGKYTLLIKEKEGYFVPLFDTENNLNPITVKKGKTELGTFVINYAAYY